MRRLPTHMRRQPLTRPSGWRPRLSWLSAAPLMVICVCVWTLYVLGRMFAAARLRPHNVLLPRGTRVVLRGLQGAPELNGREGVALEHDDAAGRYAVRLDGGEARSVKLKRENAVAKL